MGAAKFLNYSDHRIKKPLIRKNGELVEVTTILFCMAGATLAVKHNE